MATVVIDSVSKSYERQPILKNINLKINQGEFVVIVGPSGCGKSTLLRLIAGLDSITEGSILINDQCVNATPASSRDIAMVFQNYALYPHMTVFENMAYALKMRKMSKKEIAFRVQTASEMLHLNDYWHRKPAELSGGQRQRVAMGRAIVRSPAVFLFDEPLSNLDFKLRTEMRHEIKKLHKNLNATCIYVTHDQTEAMTMADKLVVLNQGKVEQVGTPRDVYEYPETQFVASFLGHYPMNFIGGRIDHAHQRLNLMTGVHLTLPQWHAQNQLDDIVLGCRPEHLTILSQPSGNSFAVNVEVIDDMGSDKLVRAITQEGELSICVRVPGDFTHIHEQCYIQIDIDKAMIFDAKCGRRLGGWRAQ